MTTRAEIIEVGRSFLDTPFEHQGRLPGVGLDCVGVPIVIAHITGLSDFDVTGYPRRPDCALFRRLCRANLDEIPMKDLMPGDLLSFAFEVEQHLALVTSTAPLTILHAYEKIGKVVEHLANAVWTRRFRTAWRFRGVAD